MRREGRLQARVCRQVRFDLRTYRLQIEHHLDPFDDLRQRANLRAVQAQQRLVRTLEKLHMEFSGIAIEHDRSGIAILRDVLHARNRPQAQVVEHGAPVEGWPVAQSQRDVAVSRRCQCVRVCTFAQRAGSSAVDLLKHRIEAPHTAEARRKADARHGQLRFVDQLLGKVQTLRVGDSQHRHAQMLLEQSGKLAFADVQCGCQGRYASLVKHTSGDQLQGPRHRM